MEVSERLQIDIKNKEIIDSTGTLVVARLTDISVNIENDMRLFVNAYDMLKQHERDLSILKEVFKKAKMNDILYDSLFDVIEEKKQLIKKIKNS